MKQRQRLKQKARLNLASFPQTSLRVKLPKRIQKRRLSKAKGPSGGGLVVDEWAARGARADTFEYGFSDDAFVPKWWSNWLTFFVNLTSWQPCYDFRSNPGRFCYIWPSIPSCEISHLVIEWIRGWSYYCDCVDLLRCLQIRDSSMPPSLVLVLRRIPYSACATSF